MPNSLAYCTPEFKLPHVCGVELFCIGVVGSGTNCGLALFPKADHGRTTNVIAIKSVCDCAGSNKRATRLFDYGFVAAVSGNHIKNMESEVFNKPRIALTLYLWLHKLRERAGKVDFDVGNDSVG